MFDECAPRIHRCLNMLPEEAIWRRPNPASNSAGNLVLHLCGNIRQWIGNGLGKLPDIRTRDAEFAEQGPIPRAELLRQLDAVMQTVDQVLNEVTLEDLSATRTVQVYEETGLSILVHVVEHFSYHVGQIAYLTKAYTGEDLGFYAGEDLG